MRLRHLLPLLLLLAGACASGWRLSAAHDHAALRDGVELVTLERGRGSSRQRRTEIREHGDDISVTSVDELMAYVRPLDTPEAAIAYSDLVRELGIADSGARGMAVRPDPALTGPGGNARYSRTDAEGWGIAFEPTARLYAGGFEVSRVVLLAPVPHPVLVKVATPWRLVLLRELVLADGFIRSVDEKTLTNGQDAVRFADL
jgi:hypothetical protein